MSMTFENFMDGRMLATAAEGDFALFQESIRQLGETIRSIHGAQPAAQYAPSPEASDIQDIGVTEVQTTPRM